MLSRVVLASLALAVASPASAQDSARTAAAPAAQPPRGRDLALDPARNISIDTDEGSWLSVDVSPDGKTIVFDLLGDLYTMPSTGGEAAALTSGMQFDAQPRFSPDGKLVVFTSDRDGGDNVWTIDVATKQTEADHARQEQSLSLSRVDARRQLHRRRARAEPDWTVQADRWSTRTRAPARSSSVIRSPCSPARSRSAHSAPRSARTSATSGSRSAPPHGSTTPACRSIRS